MKHLAGSLLSILAVFSMPAVFAERDMRFTSTLNKAGIEAPGYALDIGYSASNTTVAVVPAGEDSIWSLGEFFLVDGGIRYSYGFHGDPPDRMPAELGALYDEFHHFNLVLRDAYGNPWPGLAALSFYAHPDRLYCKIRFITYRDDDPDPDVDEEIYHYEDGITDEKLVYAARPGFGNFIGPSAITQVGIRLASSTGFRPLAAPANGTVRIPEANMGFISTTPGRVGLFSTDVGVSTNLYLICNFNESWTADTDHDFGLMFAPGKEPRDIGKVIGNHFNTGALGVDSAGLGYYWSPMRGTLDFARPAAGGVPRGTIYGYGIALTNTAAEPVDALVRFQPRFGIVGIAAGYLARDTAGGDQLPMAFQCYAAYGPNGGNAIFSAHTVPANGTLAFIQQVLYRGSAGITASSNYIDYIQRDILQHSLNEQSITHVTVNGQEALTIRHDPFFFTDWRKQTDNLQEEYRINPNASDSAASTRFLDLRLASGEDFKLYAKNVESVDTANFFVEETFGIASEPEGVSGTIRYWQAAWNDESAGTNPWGDGNCRFGAEVDLHVDKTFVLDTASNVPLSFLSVVPGGIGGYVRKFTYVDTNNTVQVVDISGDAQLGPVNVPDAFFWGFFDLPNKTYNKALDGGPDLLIPLGDTAGCPAVSVWDYDVAVNGTNLEPALRMQAVLTGLGRELALDVVPKTPLSSLGAGSSIAFKMMGSTGGHYTETNGAPRTSQTYAETNYYSWRNIAVTASVGQVLSTFPPKVRADAAGNAEFAVTGGTEWIPVRIVGVNPDLSSLAIESGPDAGSLSTLGPPVAGEPYYQLSTDADGVSTLTALVNTSGTNLPLVRVVRVTSGTGAEDNDGDAIANTAEGSGDADRDGIPNYLDPDADANTVPDAVEGAGDTDGDGIPDFLDSDNDNDLADDQLEVLLGNGLNDGFYSCGFDVDGAFGGWESDLANFGAPTATNGTLAAPITGADSKIVLKGLDLDGNKVSTILLRMELTTGGTGLQLFWADGDGGFGGGRSAGAAYLGANKFYNYAFDLGGNSNWVGKTITALRIDPVSGLGVGGTASFDWIRFGNGDLDGDGAGDAAEGVAGTAIDDSGDFLALGIRIAPAATNMQAVGRFEAKAGHVYRFWKKTVLAGTNAWTLVKTTEEYGTAAPAIEEIEPATNSQAFYFIEPVQ
jgi:hypothetical protein